MNKFFKRLPLPAKFTLIGLIPFAFIIYLTIQVYGDETEKVNLLQGFLQRIYQTGNINNLITELEAERKYSYLFTLKGENKNELILQRIRTDSAIKEVQKNEDLFLNDFTKYTFLKDIKTNRTIVDTGHLRQDAVMYFYTNVIYRLNTLNAIPGGTVSYLRPVYKDIIAQKLISEITTFLGIISTNIYNVLYTRKYMYETLFGTRGVYDVYKTYETEFFIKAPSSTVEAYKKLRNDSLRNDSSLKATVEYVDHLFKTFKFDSTYDAVKWQEVSSSGLQQLKSLQKSVWNTAQAKLDQIYQEEKAKKNRTVIFLLMALLFVVCLVFYTLRVITKMLSELKRSAQKISKGDTGVEYKDMPRDVIGSLAESICEIDENNKILSRAANEIGKGNFDVEVVPRSKEDILGNSLVIMKKNLQHIMRENDELMRKKDEFMSIASHELKTPITSVKAAIQIVERFSLQQKEMMPVNSFITKASKQIDKLTNIINDLLDVTKIQSGKLELVKTEFLIQELIKEAYDLMQFNLNGHEIILEGDADIKVKADKDRLEQVMTNLISNGVKYSPQSDKIIINVLQQNNSVKISVTDFGIGVAKEKIPFIFDRYFRVEESSQEFSGLGLGLYISSEIVKRHGGEIGVNSEPSKGSTFWFTIPAN